MKRKFLFTSTIYLLLATIIFPYTRWFADNPDTFQYIDIAKKYLTGDFPNAINGYWSPMISWLLTIPLFVFEDELLAFRILQLLIGFFTLYQWLRLVDVASIDGPWKKILVVFIIPFLIDYGQLNLTPDFLFLGLLMWLLNSFIRNRFISDTKSSLKTGIAGAFLFLTKAFGFPFFLVITMILFLLARKQKTLNKMHAFALLGSFLLITSVWISVISFHYKKFTISEAATFNMSIDAAPVPGRSEELPVLNAGLFPPAEHASSAWESPGNYVSKESVSLFQNQDQYIQVVKRNLLSVYYFDFRNQTGIIFLILFLLYIFKKGWRTLWGDSSKKMSLLFILLIYSGYSLILVHTRYTWMNGLLMVLLSVSLIQQLVNEKFRFTLNFLIIFVGLLSLKRPVKEILMSKDEDVPAQWIYQSVMHPFQTMSIFYKPDLIIKSDMDQIRLLNLKPGNAASLKVREQERDPYTNSLRIARDNNWKYYGQVENKDVSEQIKELADADIDYLITYENTSWREERPVYSGVNSGLRIFAIGESDAVGTGN